MRGLLIVNRHATSMTATVTDLAVRALAGLVDLEVERTQYRGHARELAAASDADLVIVHGGDGSINEAVNGAMSRLDSFSPGGNDRPQTPPAHGGPARPPMPPWAPGGGDLAACGGKPRSR